MDIGASGIARRLLGHWGMECEIIVGSRVMELKMFNYSRVMAPQKNCMFKMQRVQKKLLIWS